MHAEVRYVAHSPSSKRVLLVLGVAVLVLIGCAGEEARPESLPADHPAYAGNPISVALGVGDVSYAELTAEVDSVSQESITECMSERGFDYAPLVAPGISARDGEESALIRDLTHEEFRQQYGFGLSTLLPLEYDEEAVRSIVESLAGVSSDAEMTDAERAAFDLALNGSEVTDGNGESPTDKGCVQLARGEDRRLDLYDNFNARLGSDLDSMYERMWSSAEVVDMQNDWAQCMGASGYSWGDRGQMFDEVDSKVDEIRSGVADDPHVASLVTEARAAGIETMSRDQRIAYLTDIGAFEGFEALAPSMVESLAELQTWEKQVAVADLECFDLRRVDAIYLQYANQFVDQHQSEIDALREG